MYRDYGFKETPFLEESLDYEMRGRSKEWGDIQHYLNRALTETGPKTILILGDYGYGKTFILEKIIASFTRNEFKNAGKSIVASIRLAESEPEARIGLSLVTKIFYEIGFEKLVNITENMKEDQLRPFSGNFPKVIKGLKKKNFAAYEWLIGESISTTDKKELDVRKILSTSREAIRILYDFLKLLKIAGYYNLVVLIDEFEYVVNVYSERQITTILHTFKEIYDEFIRTQTKTPGSMANFIFVIAMTPKGWGFLTETESKMSRKTGGGGITPWMDRIRYEQFSVILGPLNREDTTQMLIDRIEKKRIEYKKFPYSTFPFIHPEFFNVVYEASEGVPRTALKMCDLILDAALKEALKEITGEDTKRILKKFNVLPEELS